MLLDPISTPDVSQDDVYIVDSSIPIENLLGGNPDDIRYFVFANDSVFESNSNIKLQAGVDFQGKVGDTLVLLYDGTDWLELSRSLNPLYSGGALNDYTLDSGYILNEINSIKDQIALIQQQLSYIGATFEDKTIYLDPSMSCQDIQNEIDNIKPNLVNNATVKFIFHDGYYTIDETLVFRNFHGDGKIEILAANCLGVPSENLNVRLDSYSQKIPAIKIESSNIDFSIYGIECYYSLENDFATNLYGGIVIRNSNNIKIDNCYVYTINDNGYDIYYENSSGIIKNTFTNEGFVGIRATDMARVSIDNCFSNTSHNPQYGISANNGSEISLWNNNSPSGDVDNTLTENGGRIYS